MTSDSSAVDRSWFYWHLTGAAVLLCATPQFLLGEALWSLPLENAYHLVGLCVAYLSAAAAVTFFVRRSSRYSAVSAVSAAAFFFAIFFLGLLMLRGLYYSRRIVLGGSALSAALLVLPVWKKAVRKPGAVGMCAVLVGAITLGILSSDEGSGQRRTVVSDSVLLTTYEAVRAVYYQNFVDPGDASGGAIESVGDEYLLVTGDGDFYSLDFENDPEVQSLDARTLDLAAPLNSGEFRTDVSEQVNLSWFRVADLLVRVEEDELRLFVSHHHWKRSANCFVLRLSVTSVPQRLPLESVAPPSWTTLYETKPCLPIKDYERGFPFAGLQAGGRLAFLDSEHLLFSVGDHEFDGWNSARALPQDRSADYGKTLVIGLGGSRELLTLGHRNQQGLAIDSSGRIWSTEHGPKGGDELNRLVRGQNYGWPYKTFGTEYRLDAWPLTREDGESDSFRSPIFAWVPSIGVSNLVWLRGHSFDKWRGDLLVSSLKDQSLYRMRLDGDRVAYVEPIEIGYRIRDLVEGPDGNVVLWTDDGAVVSLSPVPSDESGLALFRECAECHSVGPRAAPGLGPNLWHVVGRPIGSSEAFSYSRTLESMEGRWTVNRLDAFLADPDSFAPGTTMDFPGITDAESREALIEYLKKFE